MANAGTPRCGSCWFPRGANRIPVCLRSPVLPFKMDNDSRRAGHTLRDVKALACTFINLGQAFPKRPRMAWRAFAPTMRRRNRFGMVVGRGSRRMRSEGWGVAEPLADAEGPVPVEGNSKRREPLARPGTVDSRRVLWAYVVTLLGMHVLALAALVPWLFHPVTLVVCVVGVYFFGQGINFCYHRLLTHHALVIPKWLERFWLVMVLCCLEDTPCKWVTTHRHHHKHADHEDDPHSPLVSFFWSHFQWLTLHNTGTRTFEAYHRYAKDILSDPFCMSLEKRLWLAPAIYVAHAIGFFLAGLAGGWLATGSGAAGLQLGASLLVWGVIVRTVLVWHITWSVNSVTHTWGYRTYETQEQSRNNWLIAILAVGEGWHNNHHYDQASASNQHRWWELDLTYWHIRLLERLGLATKVNLPRHRRGLRRSRAAQGPATE